MEIPKKCYGEPGQARAPDISPAMLLCTVAEAIQGRVGQADAPAFTVPSHYKEAAKSKKVSIRFGVRVLLPCEYHMELKHFLSDNRT